MAPDPDQLEQEIRNLRQEISARFDNLRERTETDAREAIDSVKSLISRSGVEDGMRDKPYVWLGGAVAAGVIAGVATGSVHLPKPSFGGGGPTARGDDSGSDGMLAALIGAMEGVVIAEGKDALQTWLRSSNGHTSGPDDPGEPENELGTSIPPPTPIT
jgi:hypothetical protein